jgi:hypothetical protein
MEKKPTDFHVQEETQSKWRWNNDQRQKLRKGNFSESSKDLSIQNRKIHCMLEEKSKRRWSHLNMTGQNLWIRGLKINSTFTQAERQMLPMKVNLTFL